MAHTVVVRGHVVGSTVQLDEPVPPNTVDVEVVFHVRDTTDDTMTVGQYIRSLPAGTRSKEDIDQQIREERDSWRD